MFTLTTTHLRFTCAATTPLRLEVENFRAGQNLRGALGQVMQRAYCAHAPTLSLPRSDGGGDGGRGCPVCWLLAANEKPGQERRGYALVPPTSEPAARGLAPGERFEFGLTLFGNALQFLPYFVLAVPEMGWLGVGPGRGKFALKSVWAVNPFTHARECLLAEGDTLVHSPTLTIKHAQVLEAAERLIRSVIARNDPERAERVEGCEAIPKPVGDCFPFDRLRVTMTIQFLTPMRLIEEGELSKTPDFAILFARLLKRLDELEEQHGGGTRRALDEVEWLHDLARRVQLVETQTRWVEVWSGSTRRGKPSPMGGFIGRAVYAAPVDVWRPLLPWLLWGQLAQVGKDTVKGNGVIEVGNQGLGDQAICQLVTD